MKRYQVFVSSTYADLKIERQKVIQTLMEMDCIPSGMELFPAADEEQWNFIKKIIDDCDYYMLIIGGRYGTMTSEGISYTEKEFDYAVNIGLKVIALIHETPEDLPVKKSDVDCNLRDKLAKFRAKVSSNRVVKYWKNAAELPGIVSLSLAKTIKTYPAVGWVRANVAANAELYEELKQAQDKIHDLEGELTEFKIHKEPIRINLAKMESPVDICGRCKTDYHAAFKWNYKSNWLEIFTIIAPYLLEFPNDGLVKSVLSNELHRRSKDIGRSPRIDSHIFQTIKVQLLALELISVNYNKTTAGNMALFWSLTAKGKELMLMHCTVTE